MELKGATEKTQGRDRTQIQEDELLIPRAQERKILPELRQPNRHQKKELVLREKKNI